MGIVFTEGGIVLKKKPIPIQEIFPAMYKNKNILLQKAQYGILYLRSQPLEVAICDLKFCAGDFYE